jgi:hypothetical protein
MSAPLKLSIQSVDTLGIMRFLSVLIPVLALAPIIAGCKEETTTAPTPPPPPDPMRTMYFVQSNGIGGVWIVDTEDQSIVLDGPGTYSISYDSRDSLHVLMTFAFMGDDGIHCSSWYYAWPPYTIENPENVDSWSADWQAGLVPPSKIEFSGAEWWDSCLGAPTPCWEISRVESQAWAPYDGYGGYMPWIHLTCPAGTACSVFPEEMPVCQ